MRIAIIIPARYGSTRFPGKPLALIAGESMLSRVYNIARKAVENIDLRNVDIDIVIATEDQRIFDHAVSLGAKAVHTSDQCATGTDRALDAISKLEDKPDFVINLQGDAPLTPPKIIGEMIQAFIDTPNLQVLTPVTQLDWDGLDLLRQNKEKTPFSGTTVIMNKYGDAVWFSKNIIPAIRKEDDLRSSGSLSPVYRHIGMYGYRRDVLEEFVTFDMGHYETLEGLEQLRLLENGYQIRCVPVDLKGLPAMSGVDSKEDVKRTEEQISQYGEITNLKEAC